MSLPGTSAVQLGVRAQFSSTSHNGAANPITRLQAGDRDAQEPLVRAHIGPMLLSARRLLGRDDAAQAAVQAAWRRAFASLPTLAADTLPGPWLQRLAVEAALERLPEAAEVRIDDLMPRYVDDGHRERAGAAWPANSTTAELARTSATLRRSLDRIPVAYRAVLLLCDVEQLAIREVAALLHLHVEAVKCRLHRARMALRELLDRSIAAVGADAAAS